MKTISMIGFGNMAQAMVKQLCLHPTDYSLRVSSPSLTPNVDDYGVLYTHDNRSIIPKADVLILAIKPLTLPRVMQEIQSLIPDDCLIISVVAGISFEWFTKHINPSASVLRAMPNLAASIGESATPLIANAYVTSEQRKTSETLFNTMGITTWVNEEKALDAFTALSGSGPAYVLYFIESMIMAAVDMGIDEATARRFALQTTQGIVHIATRSSIELNTLRRSITSPGGTTSAALDVLMKHDRFEMIIKEAMYAAFHRAQRMDKDSPK